MDSRDGHRWTRDRRDLRLSQACENQGLSAAGGHDGISPAGIREFSVDSTSSFCRCNDSDLGGLPDQN